MLAAILGGILVGILVDVCVGALVLVFNVNKPRCRILVYAVWALMVDLAQIYAVL